MAFKTKSVSIQTLGEKLVAARNHLGTSVKEISKVAKIPPKYLEALEQGDYRALPSAVYVKGFLKTLSQVYRTPEADLLALYEAEQSMAASVALPSEKIKTAMPRFVWSPRTAAIAGLAACGLASLAYLYFQISSVKKPPRIEVFSPAQDGLAATSIIAVAGRTEAGAEVYLNNQSVVVDASGEFAENLSLAPGANFLVIKAVNKFGKETVVRRQIVVEDKQIAGAFDENSVLVEILAGPDSAHVVVISDGREVFSGTMLPGAKHASAGKTVKVSTDNGGSTRLILNGRDLGIMGKDGEELREVEFSK